ncbi:hypothetical protein HYQ46_000448 [Verticillium longisporum]|nr:hypothetical protein HYQ46_000448 [Verticillium longisporum]
MPVPVPGPPVRRSGAAEAATAKRKGEGEGVDETAVEEDPVCGCRYGRPLGLESDEGGWSLVLPRLGGSECRAVVGSEAIGGVGGTDPLRVSAWLLLTLLGLLVVWSLLTGGGGGALLCRRILLSSPKRCMSTDT